MKKTILLFTLLSLVSFKNYAQISITKEDLPVAGTYAVFGSDANATFALPETGAGKSWDYSNFVVGDTSIFSFKTASSSKYFSKFPDATLYSEDFFDGTSDGISSFFKEGPNGLYLDGIYNTAADTVIKYQKPLLEYPAPIAYGQTVLDSSIIVVDSTVNIFDVRYSQATRDKSEAVGYGTITTPAGTFNALLLKNTTYSYDTTEFISSILTKPSRTSVDTSYSYLWVQKDKTLPVVFELGISNDGKTITDAAYYSKEIPTAVNTANTNFFSHYPVPADKSLTIELKKAQEGSFTLCSMDGVVKTNFSLPYSTKITVETSALEEGVYAYEIKSIDGSSIRNKIVVTH